MNRNKLVAGVVILLLVVPLLVGFGPAGQQTPAIQLLLDAGYDQHYRPDQWTPLLLTIANDGPDVRGTLRVRAENNAGVVGASFNTPVDLPRQSRKQVFLNAVFSSYARQVVVELVDPRGTVLQSVSGQLAPATGVDVLIAVVTDSPGGSVDFSGAQLGGGTSFQANWSLENVPVYAESLLGLDVLVFSDVDTGRLSVEQQQAITDWVLAGGHLLVTGGPNYRLTTAGLADLLPVTLSGTTAVDDLTALAQFAGLDESLREPDVIVTTGSLRPGAQALALIDDQPLLARQVYGGGQVDYLAAGPELAPFRRWRHSGKLWEALVFTPRQSPSWTEGVRIWGTANNVVRQIPGFELPSALQLLQMLLLYIVIIGPLNYIVLRRIGRRELAWFTIPAVVLAFTLLAFYTGFSLRGTRATLNRLSVVQVWDGEDRARVDGLIGVLSPRRTVYEIAMPQGLTLRPLPEDNSGAGFGSVQSNTAITQTTTYSAHDVLVDASLVAGFVTNGFVDNAPQVGSRLTMSYGEGQAAYSGYVENSTDLTLENAVVLVNGGAQYLGTLDPGSRVNVDLFLRARDIPSASLSLITGGSNPGIYYYNTLNITTQDVMGTNFQANQYQYIDTPQERLNRQRQLFLSSVSVDQDLTGGRGDRAFLVGWSDTSLLDVNLTGAAWEAADMTLFIFELPVLMTASADEGSIPPGLSTWALLPDNTVVGANPYQLILNGTDQAAFRFAPLERVHMAAVTDLTIGLQRSTIPRADVFLWNRQTESWDIMPSTQSGGNLHVDDPAPYLGAGLAVDLLLKPVNPTDIVTYERLDVTWGGTF